MMVSEGVCTSKFLVWLFLYLYFLFFIFTFFIFSSSLFSHYRKYLDVFSHDAANVGYSSWSLKFYVSFPWLHNLMPSFNDLCTARYDVTPSRHVTWCLHVRCHTNWQKLIRRDGRNEYEIMSNTKKRIQDQDMNKLTLLEIWEICQAPLTAADVIESQFYTCSDNL